MDTPNKRETELPDPARRKLLRAAPLGALAVAATVTGGASATPAAAPAAAPEPEAKPRGYHETEHIRRYYRSAAYW